MMIKNLRRQVREAKVVLIYAPSLETNVKTTKKEILLALKGRSGTDCVGVETDLVHGTLYIDSDGAEY